MSSIPLEIADAINSIPTKKFNLKKSFDALKSHSPSLSSFTLQWQDLDHHFSGAERSLHHHHRLSVPQPKPKPKIADPIPRPELRSLCTSMDSKRLACYVTRNFRWDVDLDRDELVPAIRLSPDPARLVLDAMVGFYPDDYSSLQKRRIQAHRRAYLALLRGICDVAPMIGGPVKARAKRMAVEWKEKITRGVEGANTAVGVTGFLQLVLGYGLVSEFDVDDVLDMFLRIPKGKKAFDLINALGLAHAVPDLIQKLNRKCKQLDSLKLMYAFNIVDKYQPISLINAYIRDYERRAEEVRMRDINSSEVLGLTAAKERGALRRVLKVVAEYKVEYPCEDLLKRIAKLHRRKNVRQRAARAAKAAAAAANSGTQQQQQLNKRLRPSDETSEAGIACNPYPPSVPTQPHLEFAVHAQYNDSAGTYGLVGTGPVYHHAGPSFSGSVISHGGTCSPPRSSSYSSGSIAGTNGEYVKQVTYSRYPLSSLPSSCGSFAYR